MEMIGNICPVRACAFSCNCANRVSRPATSPPRTLCFDIFSPAPGDREVISQTERLSSIETKIAPRLVRIAVGSDPGSTDMGRLQREWISQPHSAREQIAIHPHGI